MSGVIFNLILKIKFAIQYLFNWYMLRIFKDVNKGLDGAIKSLKVQSLAKRF